MWLVLRTLFEPALIALLERSRLSRFFGVAFALLAVASLMLAFLVLPGYGLRTRLLWFACAFATCSICIWQAGSWWKRRELRRASPDSIPDKHRPGGFPVIRR
jgi:hypothetical protein